MADKTINICDWSKGSSVIGAGWQILGEEGFLCMDSTAKITAPTAELPELKVDIPVFTMGSRTPADHVKAMIGTNDSFSVKNGFSVSADILVQIHNTEKNPYGADPDDPRLGAGAIAIIDYNSGTIVNFEISNRKVITLREVFDVRTSIAGRALSMCDPHLLENFKIEPGSWHRYMIQYSLGKDTPNIMKPDKVGWFIDNHLVREVDWLPSAGPPPTPVVKPSRFKVNLAIFTLLDDLSDGMGGIIKGYDPEYKNTTFGQGATVRWRNIEIKEFIPMEMTKK